MNNIETAKLYLEASIKDIHSKRESKLLNVKKHLRDKCYKLLLLIPDEFKKLFIEEFYIAGGCIYSLYNNKNVNDYDIFLRSEKLLGLLRNYFLNIENIQKYNNMHIGDYKNNKVIITDYGITIGEFQIITKFYGKPQDVCEEFDYKHNQFCYDFILDKINVYSEISYLETNRLYFNESRPRDISGCILRLNKMFQKGFVISKEETAKMLSKLKDKGFDKREIEIINNCLEY